ncbi:class I SAM-dependent methyltransferase, partial [Akkermansiaceae bacterium]|nr:class I SAM-dependent methyltransferase [Akkermansiaceae bacterium]
MIPEIENLQPFGNGIDEHVTLYSHEDYIYRKITTSSAAFYSTLFESDFIRNAIKKSLIPATELIESKTNEEIWLKQERISHLSYFHEWPMAMIVDAAAATLQLHEELIQAGYCLLDSHPWNVVFNKDPLWVDITSIRPYDGVLAQGSLQQFQNYFIAIMRMQKVGLGDLARSAFSHAFCSFPLTGSAFWARKNRDLPTSPPVRILQHFFAASGAFREVLGDEVRQSLDSRRGPADKEQNFATILRLKNLLSELSPKGSAGSWSQYSQAGLDPITTDELMSKAPDVERLNNEKFAGVYSMLQRCREDSNDLLDVACNRGIFSLFGNLLGFKVVAVDSDEGALEDLYTESKRCDMAITIVLNDAVAPVEAQGMLSNPLPTFVERMSADCVLCLALIHHLRFGLYRMTAERQARLFSKYAKKWLILEYVPFSDEHLRANYPKAESPEDYAKEN